MACEGLRWTTGAGQTDPELASSLDLPGIYRIQAGLIDDMDQAAAGLNRAFGGEQQG